MAFDEYPAPLMVEPIGEHTATVFIVHGMSDKGDTWKKHITDWNWSTHLPHIRFIFPNAPMRDMTLVPGSRMSSWFDVLSKNDVRGGPYDEAGMSRSCQYLQQLIETEMEAGIPASRIVLGGFSQGGAISLLTAISLPFAIKGVFSLCGYLPMVPRVLTMEEHVLLPVGLRRDVKIFMGNGTNDPFVKFPWGEWSSAALQFLGFQVDFRSYLRKGHKINSCSRCDTFGFIDLGLPEDPSEEWPDVMFE